ncbi:hypothetical protein GWK47_043815 [Chionoecetes opilio]|uniref:Uncharacterized protein n=1 Tax=Chionoecetes opilio TaxID=41210 RepID=A0A8J4Y8X7_CHIOP|nr:hypothetical protein GWK47_043815 [Chionoecetes opilio]
MPPFDSCETVGRAACGHRSRLEDGSWGSQFRGLGVSWPDWLSPLAGITLPLSPASGSECLSGFVDRLLMRSAPPSLPTVRPAKPFSGRGVPGGDPAVFLAALFVEKGNPGGSPVWMPPGSYSSSSTRGVAFRFSGALVLGAFAGGPVLSTSLLPRVALARASLPGPPVRFGQPGRQRVGPPRGGLKRSFLALDALPPLRRTPFLDAGLPQCFAAHVSGNALLRGSGRTRCGERSFFHRIFIVTQRGIFEGAAIWT